MMSMVLQNLPGVQVYLDDVIVYICCRADHVTRLKAVLYRLQKAGLCLNTEKCKVYQDKLTYLGHIISKYVISNHTPVYKRHG